MTQVGPMRTFPRTFGGITEKEALSLPGACLSKDEATPLPLLRKSLPENIATMRQTEQEREKDRILHLDPAVPEASDKGQ